MDTKPVIHVITLGKCAQEILQNEKYASVQGITSAGIFLRSEKDKIIFLTNSPWRGPLTVNLPDIVIDNVLQIGDEVHMAFPDLIFPDFKIMVNDTAEVWQSDALVFDTGSLNEIFQRAEELCSALAFERKFLSFGEVLETITDSENNIPEKRACIRAWFFFKGRDEIVDIASTLERFLGLGTGLTPSGDDFITGFLLANHYLKNQVDLDDLLAKAREKTTTLSANLMASAARGSADERLMGALRFLLLGEKECAEVNKELLSYGSSSGIETLAGMLTAIFLIV